MKENNSDLIRCPYALFNRVAIKNPKTPREKIYAKNFPLFIKVVRGNFWNKPADWDDKIQEMALRYWSVIDKINFDGSNKPFKYLQYHLYHAQDRTCKHLLSKFTIPVKMNREDVSNLCPSVISLQSTTGRDDNIAIEEIIGGDDIEEIDSKIDEIYNHKLYKQLTAGLQPRDKNICLMLFDTSIPKPKRINTMADFYGVSNRRIWQIKQRIIKKLKDTAKRKGLTFDE